jgi:hypothetical protein
VLVQHSDEVLKVFLMMAGREDLLVAIKLAAAEKAIEELVTAIRSLTAPLTTSGDTDKD